MFKKIVVFFVFVFFVISLYLTNLSSHPFGGDSSELVTTMSTWGIAHPPGYPFQNFIGNVYVRIFPFLNIYSRLSLLSAFFTFLTAVLIFLTLFLLSKNYFISIFSSIFYLTLFPVWLYGIVPEVFALANFLIALQIFCLLNIYLIKIKGTLLYLFIFLLSIGLSTTHHHLFILFLPSYLYFLIKIKRIKIILKHKYLLMLGFLIGVSFYLYAPIVSLFNTKVDIENAKTIAGFFRLILRSSYGTFKAYSGSSGSILNRILDTLSTFIFVIQDFKPLGLFFIIFGFIYFFKRDKKIFYFFFISFLCILFFFFYSNFILIGSFGLATYERFLTFLYLLLIYYLGSGLYYFFLVTKKFVYFITDKYIIRKLFYFVIILILIFFMSTNIINNLKIVKIVQNVPDFENYGKDLLLTPPKNSLIFLRTDHSFFLGEHLQIVQKIRPDLTIVPMILQRSYIRDRLKKQSSRILLPKDLNIITFLKQNYQEKNYIFTDKPLSEGVWIPYGLMWKFYPTSAEFTKEKQQILALNKKFWELYHLPIIDKNKSNIIFVQDIQSNYIKQFWFYLDFLISHNQIKEAERLSDKYFYLINYNYDSMITYLKLKMYYKNCQSSAKVIDKIEEKLISKSSDFFPVIDYYKICEKDKKKVDKLYQELLILRKKENVSLEKLQ